MKFIKLFETFVNEYLYDNTLLKWQRLNNDVRVDIVENIYDNSSYLQKNWKIVNFKELLDDSYELPTFRIENKNVDELWEEVKDNCSISDVNLTNLIRNLERNGELNPIFLKNGKFFDGCHRLAAYKEFGKTEIPTVEIGSMLNMDWEQWLDGKIDFE